MTPIKHIGRVYQFNITLDIAWCGQRREPGHLIVASAPQANCPTCREMRSAYIETQKGKP